MECVGCGAEIPLASGERVGFRDACARCDADLHSCVQCAQRDPAARNECREPASEPVSVRDRANRCDWFAPRSSRGSGAAAADEREQARSALAALFEKPGGE